MTKVLFVGGVAHGKVVAFETSLYGDRLPNEWNVPIPLKLKPFDQTDDFFAWVEADKYHLWSRRNLRFYVLGSIVQNDVDNQILDAALIAAGVMERASR